MSRILFVACVLQVLTSAAWAQTQQLPPDAQGLPDEIRTLKWQTIDTNALAPLEHSRALLLMNHMLDELCANVTAEADLMSSYIETQNLGSRFAGTAPPPAPPQLSYAHAEKVAVALLRGPMNQSYYATELGDVPQSTLVSYVQMYRHTCQRRWSEFDESRHLVRCMGSFLGNSGRLQDYEGWATAESARREAAHQKQSNPGGAPAPGQQTQAQMQQIQQMGGALAAVESQQQAQAQQTTEGQQQANQAQQQQQPQQQQAGTSQQPYYNSGSAYPGGYYGGYGYVYHPTGATAGAAAAGAYAGANAEKQQEQQRTAAAAAAGQVHGENEQKSQQQQAAAAAAAGQAHEQNEEQAQKAAAVGQAHGQQAQSAAGGQYHATNSSWNRTPSYNSTAHSQTEQRMNSFHSAPQGSRSGGERR